MLTKLVVFICSVAGIYALINAYYPKLFALHFAVAEYRISYAWIPVIVVGAAAISMKSK